MKLLRVIAKPFMIRHLPEEIKKKSFAEEVIGTGFHPEKLRQERPVLFKELPRIALDTSIENTETIESIRQNLNTMEKGAGKIFVFNIEKSVEF